MGHCTLTMRRLLALALVAALAADAAHARQRRSHGERAQFVREQACPATGEHKLPCPGWIIDHVIALCVGGPDKAWNMQWQTVVAAKAKDRWECKAPITP